MGKTKKWNKKLQGHREMGKVNEYNKPPVDNSAHANPHVNLMQK